MDLKPFFSYYGGKWRVAKHYPNPTHSTITEPFAGSAGYSIRHYQNNIILCDIDPVIYSLWDYLIKCTPSEINRLPLDIKTDVDSLKVCQEAKYLIGFWVNKGSVSPRNMPTSWYRSGLYLNQMWGLTIRSRIAYQVSYIKHWKVFNCSYLQRANYESTYFIDPPYQQFGSLYKYNKIDYKKLSYFCKNRKGQVIACERPGANYLPFIEFRNVKGTKHTSTEFIWTNSKEID